MIVKIDKLSHDFRGIAKPNDKVTFVSDTLPGEVVDIKITCSKKNINEAKVLSYIEKSEDRVDAVCPYYDLCGGCDTSYIRYDKALEYKKNIVIDILKRYANIDVNPDIIYDNNIYGYRNKITLRVIHGKLALVGTDNELVNISKCLLVNDNINNVIKLLNNIDLTGVFEVIIKGTTDIMVIVSGNIDNKILVGTLNGYVKSIVLNNNVIYGSEYIKINVKNYVYAIYPKSFFQVNTDMIEKLYDKVLEYAGTGDSLLDLYCGAGTIGIYLASNFKYVHGIEVNSDAIDGANLNKKINDISNISFECKKANEIDNINSDVVVVDPPRAGLDKTTINKLISGDVNRIVYVSCNPITLARDLDLLKEKFEISYMTLFDMFPNTKHVESVVLLNKII